MRMLDLTSAASRHAPGAEDVPVVVRSVGTIATIPLDRLVTLATVINLTMLPPPQEIDGEHLQGIGVAGIGGVILATSWRDRHLAGADEQQPVLSVSAAAYLLQGGVQTVAADFPIANEAADLLLHNNCVLVHCLSGVAQLRRRIVRLVALPLKLEDTYSAQARVIAIEEEGAPIEANQFCA